MGARDLYERSINIDMRAFPTWSSSGMETLRNSGLTMIHTHIGDIPDLLMLRQYIDDNRETVSLVESADDVRAAKQAGKTGIMISIEHPLPLERGCSDYNPVVQTHLVLLEQFYRLGVRAVQPSYNRRTAFGDGCTERTNAGLSRYGVELVEKMNGLGMVVQPSHCGEQTTLDCIEFSSDPVCISHSGCRAVYDHPRTKSDEILRRLADKGGVFCVYALSFFVSADPKNSTVDDVVDHIEHALNVAGTDHVGIGTDYGVSIPGSMRSEESYMDSRKFKYQPVMDERYPDFVNEVNLQFPPIAPEIAHERRLLTMAEVLETRGYSDDVIEKVLGANIMRVLDEVMGS